MYVNGNHIAKLIEQHFPKHLAESWDNVGFLVGSPNSRIEKLMTALELTPAVLEEAVDKNVDLLVVHHPLIFKPLKAITDETETGRLIKDLLKHKIGLYVAHTNLDAGAEGLANYFANAMGIMTPRPIEITHHTAYIKLVTYVPKEHAEKVADAIAVGGGGQLGNYDNCHFFLEGMGMFRPLEGSNPFVGEVGQLERVEEVRIETIVPRPAVKHVVTELLKAHPYEVPAYDLIPLENELESYGIGAMGHLPQAISFESLCERVKEIFGVKILRGVKVAEHNVRHIAICPGAGADYISMASKAGCEVLITGDLKYHEAQLARSLRLSIIDVGHYESEAPYMNYFSKWLEEQCDRKGYEVKIASSQVNANPLEYFEL